VGRAIQLHECLHTAQRQIPRRHLRREAIQEAGTPRPRSTECVKEKRIGTRASRLRSLFARTFPSRVGSSCDLGPFGAAARRRSLLSRAAPLCPLASRRPLRGLLSMKARGLRRPSASQGFNMRRLRPAGAFPFGTRAACRGLGNYAQPLRGFLHAASPRRRRPGGRRRTPARNEGRRPALNRPHRRRRP
jgi:hypothetical protein